MCTTLVALALARLAYGLVLPSMRSDLGFTVQQAGVLSAATSFGYVLFVLPVGFLASAYGPRISIITGLLLASFGFAGLSQLSGFSTLFLLMSLLGVGTALIYTPVVAFVVGWYPTRRGAVLGVVNSGIGIGVLLCGLFIPRVIEQYGVGGWRHVWFCFFVFTVLILMAAIFVIKNPPVVDNSSHSTVKAVASVSVFRRPMILLLASIYGVLGFTYIVQAVFMFSYATDTGVSPSAAGALSSIGGVLSIIFGVVWGSLSDVIGRARTLMLCFFCNALATVIPVILPTFVGFTVHYVVAGMMVSGIFATVLAATSERVSGREVPIAIGFVTVVFGCGQFLGPVAAGWVIDITGSFRYAFVLSSVMMLVGAVLGLLLAISDRTSE